MAKIKAMRQKILFSAVNSEDDDERYYIKEDLSDFLKEKKEEDSEDSKPPSKKKAKRSISPLTGKNFQWFLKPSQQKFTRLSSVRNFNAKGKGAVKTILFPIEIWSLLFSDDVLSIILKYTNQEIEQSCSEVKSHFPRHLNMLDMLELKAFIGFVFNGSRTKKKSSCT